MQPDVGNPFNAPSFPRPLPLPVADPDASPARLISVNCGWLPYIRGALMQLTQQYTWPQDDPAAVLLAQQRAMTLIALFDECAGENLPFACFWDFTGMETNGFTLRGGYSAEGYSEDTLGTVAPGGWSDTQISRTSPDDRTLVGIDIEKTFTATLLQDVQVHYTWEPGSWDNPSDDAVTVELLHSGSLVAFAQQTFSAMVSGSQILDCSLGLTLVDQIIVTFFSTIAAVPINLGSVQIPRITVIGAGRPIC